MLLWKLNKVGDRKADVGGMMISDREARMAAQTLQTNPHEDATGPIEVKDVSPELMARIRAELTGSPETREDRVAAAREHLAHGEPAARDIADKLISRVLADSIR